MLSTKFLTTGLRSTSRAAAVTASTKTDLDSNSNSESPWAMAPGDLLIEIALFLETRQDLLNFCLTSKHAFRNVSSVLYESVILESSDQCLLTLGMLSRTTSIARHVRSLTIRLQSRFPTTHLTLTENSIASTAVRQAAGTKCLDALVKFRWDADDLPYHDDMWFALRAGCPQLRHIGTSLGTVLPNANSHLFDFGSLKGFSLTLKHGFYEHHTDLFVDEDDPLFQQFRSMLIHRSPNLEDLSIEGRSTVPADVHFLLEGNWPLLRRLSLGDVCVDWFPRSLHPTPTSTATTTKRPFIHFLESHPTLERLSISRHTIQPTHLSTLSPASLSQISHFSGTHQQLQALTHLHPTVHSVSFRDAVETRDVSAPTVASLLRDLPKLTTLKIAFSLHSMYDSGNLLRSLIHSAPRLRQLSLTCAHKPSFQLDAFAKTIRGFVKLRSLHLSIVRYPGDETLAVGATRIARCNPNLSTFSLTFIPPVYPVPLPFSFGFAYAYRPFSTVPVPFAWGARRGASGVFSVELDEHGLPLRLTGVETSSAWSLPFSIPFPRHLPWSGVTGTSGSDTTASPTSGTSTTPSWTRRRKPRKRRYERDLRAGGDPQVRMRGGWRAVLGLVLEQSAAGDEMRIMLFCAFLAFLAVCGILANASASAGADAKGRAGGGVVGREVVEGVGVGQGVGVVLAQAERSGG